MGSIATDASIIDGIEEVLEEKMEEMSGNYRKGGNLGKGVLVGASDYAYDKSLIHRKKL